MDYLLLFADVKIMSGRGSILPSTKLQMYLLLLWKDSRYVFLFLLVLLFLLNLNGLSRNLPLWANHCCLDCRVEDLGKLIRKFLSLRIWILAHIWVRREMALINTSCMLLLSTWTCWMHLSLATISVTQEVFREAGIESMTAR